MEIKGDPGAVIARWRRGVKILTPDVLYALERQKTRIVQRTARGVDYANRPFAKYSQNGPYYYKPNADRGTFSARQERTAAARLKRQLSKGTKGAGEMQLSRTGRSIRFESYAAFKTWLGRVVVDLRGARAPHMLQALVIRTGEAFGKIGIYGQEAARASGHHYGSGDLPKRRFLGANEQDVKLVAEDMKARIMARVKK